jgi:hypothetical protein
MAEYAGNYALTDELRAQLQPWARCWIGNAMSTKPMDEKDRRAMRLAVRGLYEAAGLTPPPDHRIVFVPSPIVLRLAGGFAAAIWAMSPVQNEFNRIFRNAGTDVLKLAEALFLEAAKKAGKACATRFATEETASTATYRAMNGSVTDLAWQEMRAATWGAVETTNAATFFPTNIATFEATHDAAEAAASGAGVAVALRGHWVRRIKDTLAEWVNGFVVGNANRAASQIRDSFEMKLYTERATAVATQAATDSATPMRDMVKRINSMLARWVNYLHFRKASCTASEVGDSFEVNLRTETARVAGQEWYVFGDLLTIATRIMGSSARLGLSCALSATGTMETYQGGNQCSPQAAFVSFFRHVAGWNIDYSRWRHWEAAAVHGGPRIMHEKFCMISDRPRVLTVDEQMRPHNPNGPFCQWADGSALYAWHGVHTPAKYFLREHSAKEILAEPNVEVRRAMIERYDSSRQPGQFLIDAGAKILDSAIQPIGEGQPDQINELLCIDLPGEPDGRILAVRVIDPSTGRQYILRVHPELRPMTDNQQAGEPQEMKVRNAIASTFGMRGEEYVLAGES